jgi:hypothetical protein
MSKDDRRSRQLLAEDMAAWRVVDDFGVDVPVTPAELDAVEAFLMPLVNAIMAGPSAGEGSAEGLVNSAAVRSPDSEVTQSSARC